MTVHENGKSKKSMLSFTTPFERGATRPVWITFVTSYSYTATISLGTTCHLSPVQDVFLPVHPPIDLVLEPILLLDKLTDS